MIHSQAPVRIVFCITDLDPGGAERALVEIVTRLDRSRWAPVVVSLQAGGSLASRLQDAGIEVISLGVRSRFDLGVVWRLSRLLRRLQPVILQTFLHHANLTGRIAARLAGVPIVVSGVRVAERRSRWRLRFDRWTDFLVKKHVCVSQGVARFSIEQGGLPKEKVCVIFNGVDAERFANARPADLGEFGIPADAFVVLSVGRLDPQKAPDVLLKAVRPLLPRYPSLHVLYTGDGPLRDSLENEVNTAGIGSHVHFAGWRRNVPELLRASSVFVLCSRWEGMPNVVLEAMAAGVPVISTRVEGIGELVCDGKDGELVPIDEPERLAAAIASQIDCPERPQKSASMAQVKVIKYFTWDESTSRFASLYDDLLGEQPR